MKTNAWTSILVIATTTSLLSPLKISAAVMYSGGTYSQNFDTLATSGSANAWANDTTVSGWHLFNKDSAAITTYSAANGSDNAGSFYSFGTTASSERALGGIGAGGSYFGSPASGAIAGWIAVAFQNTSPHALTSFTLTFNGEQWRNSGASAQTMVFEYGFGSTFSGVSTWNTPGGNFDWNSPVTGGSANEVDGNAAGLVSGRGGTINSSWAQNDTLWLRWVERNDSGNDHGLAIDDLSFIAVPEAAHYALFCSLGLLVIGSSRSLRSYLRQRRAT